MKHYEITGTYGSGKTETTVFVYVNRNGSRWYVCEGGENVNLTYDEIGEGCDIEPLKDVDMFTASKPVNSLEDLINEIEN